MKYRDLFRPPVRVPNPAHRLCPLLYVPCNEGAGAPRAYVKTGPRVTPVWVGTPARGVHPNGKALLLGGTSDYIDLGNAQRFVSSTTSPFTIAWTETVGATPGAYEGIINLHSGSTYAWIVLRTTDVNFGPICFGPCPGTLAIVQAAGAPALVAGKATRFLITGAAGVGSITAADYTLWANGVKYATTATNVISAITPQNYFGWDGADSKWKGVAGELALWNRMLSDDSIRAYFRDPYRFTRQIRKTARHGAAGGAAYTLAESAGAFVLTGNATGLTVQRKLVEAAGSFTFSGQAAGLTAQRKLVEAAGSFAFTGNAMTPTAGRKLTEAAGSFTLSGQAMTATVQRRLSAALGAFVLSGQDATLTYSGAALSLAMGTGVFALTGNAVGLRIARTLRAEAAMFTLTGGAATLSWSGAAAGRASAGRTLWGRKRVRISAGLPPTQ